MQCSSPFSPSGYLSCTFAPCSLFQSSCVPGQLPQSPGANLPRTTPAPTPPPTTPPPTSAVPTPSCGVNNILGGQVPVCAATTHYGAGFAGVWVVPLAHTCDGARLTGLTVSTSGTFNPAGLVTNMANPDAVSGLANCSAPSVDSSGQLTGPSPRVVCSLANPTAQLSDFTTGTLPLASVNDGTAAGVPSRFQFAYLDPETPCGDARDPAAPAWTFTVESASFERVP